MKKVSSSASYSEFRKKNPNIKQQAIKETGILEIDELSKQLQAMKAKKKININKYDHPNGIIEEEEQDQVCITNSGVKAKNQNSATKKLKVLTTKLEPQSKNQVNKLNKSIQTGMILGKREKQVPSSKQINMKSSTKLIKKQQKEEPKLGRRMSLTTLGKGSLISTNESINTSISQSQASVPMLKKKQLIERLAQIESKLSKKPIPVHLFEQIMQKVDKIEQVLEQC